VKQYTEMIDMIMTTVVTVCKNCLISVQDCQTFFRTNLTQQVLPRVVTHPL